MCTCICPCCQSHGTIIEDCRKWIIREPDTEVIHFRSPLMRDWAIQCFDDFQVLNRRGRKWVVVSYNLSSCTLREVLLIKR